MLEFIAHIKDSKITNKKTVREKFDSLTDGRYLITIKSVKHRTLPQNAYYWGVVVPMVFSGLRDAGFNDVKTKDDAHSIMKHLFLKRKIVNQVNDDCIEIEGSTAELKTVEFNTYLEEIWQWAAEYLGISIPQPNEQLVIFT